LRDFEKLFIIISNLSEGHRYGFLIIYRPIHAFISFAIRVIEIIAVINRKINKCAG
jgi:hypothetical protein